MRSAERKGAGGREEVVVKGPLLELWGDVTNGGYDGWTAEGGRGIKGSRKGIALACGIPTTF